MVVASGRRFVGVPVDGDEPKAPSGLPGALWLQLHDFAVAGCALKGGAKQLRRLLLTELRQDFVTCELNPAARAPGDNRLIVRISVDLDRFKRNVARCALRHLVLSHGRLLH